MKIAACLLLGAGLLAGCHSAPGFVDGGSLLFAVVVPYAELLPLLRPASPVARMLHERDLWKP